MQVTIVGAGPVGLLHALLLRYDGRQQQQQQQQGEGKEGQEARAEEGSRSLRGRKEVVVLERRSRAEALAANNASVSVTLGERGLEVLRACCPPAVTERLEAAGLQLQQYSFVEEGDGAARQKDAMLPVFCVPRAALVRIFAEEAERAGVDIQYGTRVLQVHSGANASAASAGTVKVQVQSGTDGEERMLEADMLIVADGCFSRFRTALFPQSHTLTTHDIAYVDMTGLVPPDVTPTGMQGVHFSIAGRWLVISMPMRPSQDDQPPRYSVGIYGHLRDLLGMTYTELAAAVRHAVPSDVDRIVRSIRCNSTDASEETLASETCVHVWNIVGVRCQSLVQDRIVLVGDAAHAMPPFLGQGLNASFENAAFLCNLARASMGRDNVAERLQAYNSLRVAGCRAIVDASEFALRQLRAQLLLGRSQEAVEAPMSSPRTPPGRRGRGRGRGRDRDHQQQQSFFGDSSGLDLIDTLNDGSIPYESVFESFFGADRTVGDLVRQGQVLASRPRFKHAEVVTAPYDGVIVAVEPARSLEGLPQFRIDPVHANVAERNALTAAVAVPEDAGTDPRRACTTASGSGAEVQHQGQSATSSSASLVSLGSQTSSSSSSPTNSARMRVQGAAASSSATAGSMTSSVLGNLMKPKAVNRDWSIASLSQLQGNLSGSSEDIAGAAMAYNTGSGGGGGSYSPPPPPQQARHQHPHHGAASYHASLAQIPAPGQQQLASQSSGMTRHNTGVRVIGGGVQFNTKLFRDLRAQEHCWIGSTIVAMGETGSTMEDAEQAARNGCPNGTVCLAESMVRGQTRKAGVEWSANRHGQDLLFTIVLREVSQRVEARLQFMCAIAVAEALHEGVVSSEWYRRHAVDSRATSSVSASSDSRLASARRDKRHRGGRDDEDGHNDESNNSGDDVVSGATGASLAPSALRTKVQCGLKWPNDVLATGRKMSGVLVRTSTITSSWALPGALVEHGGHVNSRVAFLGIGINVNSAVHATPSLRQFATSVRDQVGFRSCREDLLARVCTRLQYWLSQEIDELSTRFWDLCIHKSHTFSHIALPEPAPLSLSHQHQVRQGHSEEQAQDSRDEEDDEEPPSSWKQCIGNVSGLQFHSSIGTVSLHADHAVRSRLAWEDLDATPLALVAVSAATGSSQTNGVHDVSEENWAKVATVVMSGSAPVAAVSLMAGTGSARVTDSNASSADLNRESSFRKRISVEMGRSAANAMVQIRTIPRRGVFVYDCMSKFCFAMAREVIRVHCNPLTHFVVPVSGEFLRDGSRWRGAADAIIMPGGADKPYVKELGEQGMQQISEFVRIDGGSYLGICAGAYFGSRYVRFDEGGEYSVCEFRDLQFCPVDAVGPVAGQYSPETEVGTHATRVRVVRPSPMWFGSSTPDSSAAEQAQRRAQQAQFEASASRSASRSLSTDRDGDGVAELVQRLREDSLHAQVSHHLRTAPRSEFARQGLYRLPTYLRCYLNGGGYFPMDQLEQWLSRQEDAVAKDDPDTASSPLPSWEDHLRSVGGGRADALLSSQNEDFEELLGSEIPMHQTQRNAEDAHRTSDDEGDALAGELKECEDEGAEDMPAAEEDGEADEYYYDYYDDDDDDDAYGFGFELAADRPPPVKRSRIPAAANASATSAAAAAAAAAAAGGGAGAAAGTGYSSSSAASGAGGSSSRERASSNPLLSNEQRAEHFNLRMMRLNRMRASREAGFGGERERTRGTSTMFVIATFEDYNYHPAAVFCVCGRGKVVLSHAHFEVFPDALSRGDIYIRQRRVISRLHAHGERRFVFVHRALQMLGL